MFHIYDHINSKYFIEIPDVFCILLIYRGHEQITGMLLLLLYFTPVFLLSREEGSIVTSPKVHLSNYSSRYLKMYYSCLEFEYVGVPFLPRVCVRQCTIPA